MALYLLGSLESWASLNFRNTTCLEAVLSHLDRGVVAGGLDSAYRFQNPPFPAYGFYKIALPAYGEKCPLTRACSTLGTLQTFWAKPILIPE